MKSPMYIVGFLSKRDGQWKFVPFNDPIQAMDFAVKHKRETGTSVVVYMKTQEI